MCQVTSNFLSENVQRINRKLEKKTGQVAVVTNPWGTFTSGQVSGMHSS